MEVDETYVGVENAACVAVGVRHDRRVQGSDPARSAEILPWVHRIFGNLKTWLRGTFHGEPLPYHRLVAEAGR